VATHSGRRLSFISTLTEAAHPSRKALIGCDRLTRLVRTVQAKSLRIVSRARVLWRTRTLAVSGVPDREMCLLCSSHEVSHQLYTKSEIVTDNMNATIMRLPSVVQRVDAPVYAAGTRVAVLCPPPPVVPAVLAMCSMPELPSAVSFDPPTNPLQMYPPRLASLVSASVVAVPRTTCVAPLARLICVPKNVTGGPPGASV